MENRHNAWDLKQMQSLPLDVKIRMSQQRIETWHDSWTRFEIVNKTTGKTRYVTLDTRNYMTEPMLKEDEYVQSAMPGWVYIAFSGGKDSTVLKHLVDQMYGDVPSLFANTGLEFPEIQRFVKDIQSGKYECFNTDVEIVRPKMRFDEVIKLKGYPMVSKAVSHNVNIARRHPDGRVAANCFDPTKTGRFKMDQWAYLIDAPFDIGDKCCQIMKKDPSKEYAKRTGRMPILGTMADESALRYANWIRNGCNSFEGSNPTSQPMSFWTEQDVLEYIERYNVPYCSVYGDIIETENGLKTTGYDRTGCIFCGFGCHIEKGKNRFQKLKDTHPRQYEYCIHGGEMVNGKWQPSKEGLGLGKVLDYIGVKYE